MCSRYACLFTPINKWGQKSPIYEQGRIKRGHRGHLPRAPFLQGAPATEKKNNIYYF